MTEVYTVADLRVDVADLVRLLNRHEAHIRSAHCEECEATGWGITLGTSKVYDSMLALVSEGVQMIEKVMQEQEGTNGDSGREAGCPEGTEPCEGSTQGAQQA